MKALVDLTLAPEHQRGHGAMYDGLQQLPYRGGPASRRHPPAKAHYQYRPAAGDTHHAALRNLFNKMLGQLYACLRDGRTFQEEIAWPVCAARPSGRIGDDLFDEVELAL